MAKKKPTGTVVPNLSKKDQPASSETQLTHQELFDLFSVLLDLRDVTANPVFSFAAAKNLELCRPVALRLSNEFKPPVEYADYEQKRIALCAIHSKRTPENEVMMHGDQFVIEDEPAFKEAITALRTAYKDAIETYQRICNEMAKVLTDGGPFVQLYRVDISLCPPLTTTQMEGILPMLQTLRK